MFSIENVQYFVPSTRLKIEDSLERFSLQKAQAKVYQKFYGLEEVPCAEGMSMVELISEPIKALLDKAEVNKNDIKYLIHAHTAKVITRFGHSVVREVQEKLQLTDALAFGTSLNNCASTLNALEIAACLLKNHDKNARAIVVTGERAFTPTVQVIPNTSITGDAAAAALISLQGKQDRLIHLEMHTEGQFYRGIWLTPEESKAFEKTYAPSLAETILKAVEKSNVSLKEIKYILPHNVNLISWENVAKVLQYPLENIYLSNVKKYAHCFGADIMMNYVDVKKANLLNPGDYYLMATVGLGATFAAAVFQH